MTQPLNAFTDADFCSGRWPVNDQPLPRRTPGEYANDPVWDTAITAPGPGNYVLDHRRGHIELWNTDGDEPVLTDGALL